VRYSVLLVRDDERGGWIARVPALNTCASGETVEEALANAREMMAGCDLVRRDCGESVPIEAPIESPIQTSIEAVLAQLNTVTCPHCGAGTAMAMSADA
jgi:predicted RNase H-like HicB family nuclease